MDRDHLAPNTSQNGHAHDAGPAHPGGSAGRPGDPSASFDDHGHDHCGGGDPQQKWPEISRESSYGRPSQHRPPSSVLPDAKAWTAPPPRQGEGRRKPRKLVLCFDGTGNKFRGDDSDSNILKIFRMLDRTASNQYHYYQPGIGTYVVSNSLSHTSLKARFKSWYTKAKDSAVGSSFDQHVVGGYRFLMRFYSPGDEIYIFGFSRGAYIARFLAEMIDYVGLLSHGNEEMVVFAWKAFAQWQCRRSGGGGDDGGIGGGDGDDGNGSGTMGAIRLDEKKLKQREEEIRKKDAMYAFLKGFRETFSRPVRRIRFLGLFDTVNSVPRFETAWMERAGSRFPYTARSSAKVVRHAVSIDERRAKFRQDLIYQSSHAGHGDHHAAKKKQKVKSAAAKVLHDIHEKYRGKHPRQQRRPTIVEPVPDVNGGSGAAAGEGGSGTLNGTGKEPQRDQQPGLEPGLEPELEPDHTHLEADTRGRRPSQLGLGLGDPVQPSSSTSGNPAPYRPHNRHHHARSKSRATATTATSHRTTESACASAMYHDARDSHTPGPLDPLDPHYPTRHQDATNDDDCRASSVAAATEEEFADIPDASDVSDGYDSSDESDQDVDEVWFAGGHGDIGGGWDMVPGEKKSASHIPLAWMVREAMRAGLKFDLDKVVAMGCADGEYEGVDHEPFHQDAADCSGGAGAGESHAAVDDAHYIATTDFAASASSAVDFGTTIPNIRVDSSSQPASPAVNGNGNGNGQSFFPRAVNGPDRAASDHVAESPSSSSPLLSPFHSMLCQSHTATLHDSLSYTSGMAHTTVLSWRLMEYLPFRRMDLQPDGSWKPIRWPLPRGEVRDVPDDARVHGSVIRRMRADEGYRPGNLIVGGGGRGHKVAPREWGMGEWVCVGEEGDLVGEVWVKRKTKSAEVDGNANEASKGLSSPAVDSKD